MGQMDTGAFMTTAKDWVRPQKREFQDWRGVPNFTKLKLKIANLRWFLGSCQT